MIVGAHGAGLINMVFAPPGAATLEIIPPTIPVDLCYWTLANAAGHRYACAAADGNGREMLVDPLRVSALVKDLAGGRM